MTFHKQGNGARSYRPGIFELVSIHVSVSLLQKMICLFSVADVVKNPHVTCRVNLQDTMMLLR